MINFQLQNLSNTLYKVYHLIIIFSVEHRGIVSTLHSMTYTGI